MQREMIRVATAARTWSRGKRPADVIAVGALLAYALLAAVLIALPLVRQALPVAEGGRKQLPVFTSLPEKAQRIVLAPRHNVTPGPSPNVVRAWRLVGGVGVNVVTVNPKGESVNIVIGLAQGTVLSEGRFAREGFASMVHRLRPRVAIDGTYFHLKNYEPVGALVMEGVLIFDGLCSSSLVISEDGTVHIEHHGFAMGRDVAWPADARTAVCCGPILVDHGRIHLNPYDEGFGDPSLFALARRSAVGVTQDGKLLLATIETPITWNKLANTMLQLGAVEALNLDGGGSTALYADGKIISQPKRDLTNLLMVYD